MTKSATKRTLLVFILIVCLTACLALFVACGGDPQQTPGGNNPPPADDSVTYTVEVKLPDGGAAAGTTVSVGAAGVTFGNPVAVDDQGKAQFSLAAGDYDVTLDNLTEHYELPENAVLKLTETSTTLTVTLVRKFAYVVNLKAPNGEPLALDSVTVGICTMSGNCLNPVPAPNGTAIIEAEKSDYHVQILGLPAEYGYVSDDNGYYTGEDFSATKTEMTITVDAVNVIDITTGYLTDAQKTELAKSIPAYNADAQKYDAKHVTKTLAPGESAYYVISPRFSGKFTVYPDQTAGSYQNIGKHYKLENSAANLYTTADLFVALDEKQYIRVYNDGEATVTASFVVTVPAASETTVTGVGAIGKTTTTVEIKKSGAAAIIEFRPTSLGAYKLTVKDDVNAAITMLVNSYGAFEDYDASAEFTKNPYVQYKVTEAWTDGKSGDLFAVSLSSDMPNDEKPLVELTVEIEKLNSIEHTTEVLAVQETLTQYAEQTGKELVGVPMDGSANLVYNNTDKFYHLGAADGPVVVVMLTSLIDSNRFEFSYQNMGQPVRYPLAYLDKHPQAGVSYIFDLTTAADIADLKKGNTYKDYSLMLRGFSKYDYDETNNPVVPDDITVQTYYTKYVNKDGVYPLTKELETFLKDLVNVYGDTAFIFAFDMEVAPENFWLFPLYYYDDVSEADVIVGEYKFVRHVLFGEETVVGGTKDGWDDETQQSIEVPITEDEYKLVVQKNGNCTIYSVDVDGNDVEETSGSWSNNNDGYTFTLGGYEFSVTFNQAAGTIKLEETDETWEFKLPDSDNA